MNAIKFGVPFFVALACASPPGSAAPVLGPELSSFAVLGASDVTSANVSNIGGNLGSYPTAPTAPAAQFNFLFGSYQPGTQSTAQTELTTARTALGAGAGGLTSLNGTFTPGTYDFGAGILGAGQSLILDGLGNNAAVWIFRFTSTLTTVQTSLFSMINVGNG